MKTIRVDHVPYNTGGSAEMKQAQILRITLITTVDAVMHGISQLRS
ncbi:MAG: hypothetical protein ACTHLX_11175 [Candidatus Binatia bacterium]|jgi:hypothetical protein